MMGFTRTHLTAATVGATANRFVASTNMIVGDYGAPANSGAMPSGGGARHVTCARTVAGNADTPGTITVTGTDLLGAVVSEALVPGANGVTVTGLLWFVTVTSVVGAGWAIDPGTTTSDTIVVGCSATPAIAQGSGTLRAVVVNTTAAGTITLADSGGTIAVLKSGIAEGFFGPFDVAFSGYLAVTQGAASDSTVIHTGSLPTTYSMG